MWTTIQIDGSSGKGTVTATVHSIMRTHGVRRLGRYIPRPHGHWPFDEICEVDGSPRGPFYVGADPCQRLREAGGEIAVLEGGAPSCEPCAIAALVSIHDDEGRAAADIARHAVLRHARRGVPLVVGQVPDHCVSVIEQVAAERETPLVWAHRAVADARIVGFSEGRATIEFRGSCRARLQARGRHELRNAVVAIAVAEQFGVPVERICWGLEACAPLPGRLDYVRRGATQVLVVFTKNPENARLLRDYLLECHPGSPICVRLKSYRDEVGAILSAAGPVMFTDTVPDVPFVTIAGPYISDLYALAA